MQTAELISGLCSLLLFAGVVRGQTLSGACSLHQSQWHAYKVRDAPVAGVRGLTWLPPYSLTAATVNQVHRVKTWECNDGTGAGFPVNAICLSILTSPGRFVSRNTLGSLAIGVPYSTTLPGDATDPRVWVCEDGTPGSGACKKLYYFAPVMVTGVNVKLRACGTPHYLSYPTTPAPPANTPVKYGISPRDFTFIS